MESLLWSRPKIQAENSDPACTCYMSIATVGTNYLVGGYGSMHSLVLGITINIFPPQQPALPLLELCKPTRMEDVPRE